MTTEPEITIGGNVDEDRFVVYVDGEPTYTLTHELGRKVGNRPAPMVRTLRYIERARQGPRDESARMGVHPGAGGRATDHGSLGRARVGSHRRVLLR
jgi:hypothetical protein